MSMVRKLSFKDPLLGLANVKWGRGMGSIANTAGRIYVLNSMRKKKNPTSPLITFASQRGTQPETWNISQSASANRMRQFLMQCNSCNSMRATSSSMMKAIWTSCQIDELSLQFLTKFNRLHEHSLWLKFECATFMIAKWCQFLPTRPLILFLFLFLSQNTSNIWYSNHDNLLETQCYSHVRPSLCESPHKTGQTLTVLKLIQVTCLDCTWATYRRLLAA
jgi:hypothetical protein